MARLKSPKYPNFPLGKAIDLARIVHDAEHMAPTPRADIAKHLGYSGISGASDATIATIIQYGLLERYSKGEMRVSQLAKDIFFPETEEQKQSAINKAALYPPLFSQLYNHYEGRIPPNATLEIYLNRNDFHERAIKLILKSFPATMAMYKQPKDSESDSNFHEDQSNFDMPDADKSEYGNAKVGDLVQWEQGGVLKFERPLRIRMVSPDGEWVAVEGSETGIPMSEIIVEESVKPSPPAAPLAPPPPKFPMIAMPAVPKVGMDMLAQGSFGGVSYEVKTSGVLTPKTIEKIIKILTLHKELYEEENEDDHTDVL